MSIDVAEPAGQWTLWRRQLLALTRRELTLTLFSRRSIPAYLLVALPFFLGLIVAYVGYITDGKGISENDFAWVFQAFILRFVVFFGCTGLFVNLFRGEVLDRSLHYLLLAPLRREVLILGKFLGGLASALLLFLPMTAVTYVLFHLSHGFGGPALLHLAGYLFVVALACVGYGALFLLAGLIFRNPMIPAGLFFGWEMATLVMGKLFKSLSVSYYLVSLSPMTSDMSKLQVLVSPAPAWLAVPGLLLFSTALLAIASWKARTLEITYATE